MEFKNRVIQTKLGEIQTMFIAKQPANEKLAFIMPGTGYTAQAPLLHYATGLYIRKEFDVVQLKYDYPADVFKNMGNEEFAEEVKAVVDYYVNQIEYKEVVFVAKSISTIALAFLEVDEIPSRHIWLMPLIHNDAVFKQMLKTQKKGLVIIGDQDPCYVKERFDELATNELLTTHLIKDTNHALEYANDIIGSVDVLKNVVTLMDDF